MLKRYVIHKLNSLWVSVCGCCMSKYLKVSYARNLMIVFIMPFNCEKKCYSIIKKKFLNAISIYYPSLKIKKKLLKMCNTISFLKINILL